MGNTIKTVSDFLLQLINKGVEDIKPYLNINHNSIIGGMYEGLTKKFLEKAIFKDMDLRVVSGKITNDAGEFSKQIDCMVVIGEGDLVPFTDNYVYHINQVIMVVEVKKNLFMRELTGGYDNLKSVIDIQNNNYREVRMQAITDAFLGITGIPFPGEENINTLKDDYQMLYHALVVEALLPIRVIFGYTGFKNELVLRENFYKLLSNAQMVETNSCGLNDESQTINRKGFGITSLPNLIVCNESSIVKTNGMPYSVVFDHDGGFVWMASYRHNPITVLLELLWTKLTYHYNISSYIFGEDVFLEGLAPLLLAKMVDGKNNGWHYTCMALNQTQLEDIDKMYNKPWQPEVLTKEEYIIMQWLCENDMPTSIKFFEKYMPADKVESNINTLIEKRLIYKGGDNVQLITKQCIVAIDPEYGYVAADDFDGRFSNWLFRNIKKNK
jgi:hypothetical protein